MAIRKIARMGHPVLSLKANPVERIEDPAIQRLIDDMIETMEDAQGAGLAAPQIHEPMRIVVFRTPAEDQGGAAPGLTVLINPELAYLTAETESDWEGCLSVPGLRGLVPRITRLRYRGLTRTGDRLDRTVSGFHARVVQHECDHLDGILYPQRMTDLSDLIFESEWRHRVRPAAMTSKHSSEKHSPEKEQENPYERAS